ncbi:MAG: LuxR C-terminal-related transcriptional regulator, partial [Desulfobacterales bacterium]
DISEQKKAERELKLSREHLEMRVMERTEALQNLNRQNIKEIEERKQAEKLLRQKETDLIKQSQELEEMNIALKVLLKQREQDKEHLETDVFNNVEKNIFPYIKKLLNRKKIGVVEREYILTIETHIKEIVSPFMRKLETTYQKLTPTEIMVANLIRDAKSTKEIAQLLDTSIQTIEFHRKNIRQKLNLNHSKINLRSHLMSLN